MDLFFIYFLHIILDFPAVTFVFWTKEGALHSYFIEVM